MAADIPAYQTQRSSIRTTIRRRVLLYAPHMNKASNRAAQIEIKYQAQVSSIHQPHFHISQSISVNEIHSKICKYSEAMEMPFVKAEKRVLFQVCPLHHEAWLYLL